MLRSFYSVQFVQKCSNILVGLLLFRTVQCRTELYDYVYLCICTCDKRLWCEYIAYALPLSPVIYSILTVGWCINNVDGD